MKILEFVVVFIFPLLLFGAAFYQMGKDSGHPVQNLLQILIYGGALALGGSFFLDGPSAREIYLTIAPLAFLFSLCLEIIFLAKTTEADTVAKIVGLGMFIHVSLIMLFLSSLAIG